jgi:hypothetical protein
MYAECHKLALYAECRYDECRYAERRFCLLTVSVADVTLTLGWPEGAGHTGLTPLHLVLPKALCN